MPTSAQPSMDAPAEMAYTAGVTFRIWQPLRRWLRRTWDLLRPRRRVLRAPARSRSFVTGFAAFRNGLTLRDNPQPADGSLVWLDWRRGFLAAQARAERRQALMAIGLDSDTHMDLPIIDPRR